MLAVFDTETTGLSPDSEIIQISCVTQGRRPFNQYLLPDKKFIAENATKIHGVSVKYQNGAKQLEKNGKLLPAVSQRQGLSDFLSFLKEIQVDSQIVLVAHNGNRFDFPILLRSLREQELLQQFLDCNILLLDSLTVITEEMKIRSSLLKECKGKSLGTIYKNLFDETFDAHDSLEDVIALSRILSSNKLEQNHEQMIALAMGGCEVL